MEAKLVPIIGDIIELVARAPLKRLEEIPFTLTSSASGYFLEISSTNTGIVGI